MKKPLPLKLRFMQAMKNPVVIAFIIILLLGIFFRFFNTPERFGFDKDPTRDALIALYGSRNLQLPLIGPHSGIADFTFGPWYYYILIFSTFLFPFVYTPFYIVPFFSLTFIILMYFIGKELKDEILGLILAGFAALSPGQVGPSAGLSNPNFVSPHAAGSLLMFVLFMKKQRPLWFSLLWGIIMGIGINHHYQMLPLLMLPLIAYGYKWRTSLVHILVFVIGMLATFIPLLYFNLLNNWHTLSGFYHYIFGNGGNYIPNSWTIYLRDFWPSFWAYLFAAPVSVGLVLGILTVAVHGYLLLKKKISLTYGMSIGVLFLFFIGLRYFSGTRDYYYLFFLQPFLFILAGMTLWTLRQYRIGKFAFGIIVFLLFSFSLYQNYYRIVDREDFLLIRDNAQLLAQLYPDSDIHLYNCRDEVLHQTEGIAYLLEQKTGTVHGKSISVAITDKTTGCPLPAQVKQIHERIYDVTGSREAELVANGWREISSESVYNETLLWWNELKVSEK